MQSGFINGPPLSIGCASACGAGCGQDPHRREPNEHRPAVHLRPQAVRTQGVHSCWCGSGCGAQSTCSVCKHAAAHRSTKCACPSASPPPTRALVPSTSAAAPACGWRRRSVAQRPVCLLLWHLLQDAQQLCSIAPCMLFRLRRSLLASRMGRGDCGNRQRRGQAVDSSHAVAMLCCADERRRPGARLAQRHRASLPCSGCVACLGMVCYSWHIVAHLAVGA